MRTRITLSKHDKKAVVNSLIDLGIPFKWWQERAGVWYVEIYRDDSGKIVSDSEACKNNAVHTLTVTP